MNQPVNDDSPEPSKNLAPPQYRPLLSRIARALLAIPAAIWLFMEEWLWDAMLAFTAALSALPPIRWAEAQIAKLPPYAALIAFVIPAAVLLPFKLIAFWLIAHGQGVLGTVVFIIAKIVGTAFLARIFALTKPALMTIGWFAHTYTLVMAWKARVYAYVRALPAYQAMRRRTRALKRQIQGWWRRLKSR